MILADKKLARQLQQHLTGTLMPQRIKQHSAAIKWGVVKLLMKLLKIKGKKQLTMNGQLR